MYDARLGRFLSVDPKTSAMPAWSPYSSCFNNPIRFVDKNGEFPIIPMLLKAGAGGAADMLAQAVMYYYFDPSTAGNIEASFGKVNWWQVSRSALEGGIIPWKTPGGRLGRAAGTALGDVMVNALDAGTDYTQEQALQDFATGFIGDLAGGGMGELVGKYGGKAVAQGLHKMGFDVDQINKMTNFNLRSTYKVGFRDEAAIGHIFRKDHGIANTEANRNLLLDVANNSSNVLGKDKHGNVWNAITRKDGTQVWTQSRNGKVFNAGINDKEVKFNSETGLSSPTKK